MKVGDKGKLSIRYKRECCQSGMLHMENNLANYGKDTCVIVAVYDIVYRVKWLSNGVESTFLHYKIAPIHRNQEVQ
jgi:hypothetical protein